MAKWQLQALSSWKHHTPDGVGYGVSCAPRGEGADAEHLQNTFILTMEKLGFPYDFQGLTTNGDWLFLCYGPGLLHSDAEMDDYDRRLTQKRAGFLLEMLQRGQRELDTILRQTTLRRP